MDSNICYSFVLLTCDRSPKPNYVTQTLSSLFRSTLPDDCRFLTYINGVSSPEHIDVYLTCPYDTARVIHTTDEYEVNPGVNFYVSRALELGIDQLSNPNDWLIFMEDDLLFCADFFNSIRRWLDRNATNDRRLYSFGCPYFQSIKPNDFTGSFESDVWSYYPTESFYGTQCFAVRRDDAIDIAAYLSHAEFTNKFQPGEYDLGIAEWSSRRYPELGYFAASRPSFVQHVGIESSIRPDGPYFNFPSFPGTEWSYNVSEKPLSSQVVIDVTHMPVYEQRKYLGYLIDRTVLCGKQIVIRHDESIDLNLIRRGIIHEP